MGKLKLILFRIHFLIIPVIVMQLFNSCTNRQSQNSPVIASFEEAMNSKQDLWGEAAMAEPNGASYEFFEKLLPPLRYVNADFRYYPIVLSAPKSKIKARLISNGSGINLSGGSLCWRNVGKPFTFRVGTDEFLFGSLIDRLSEPVLAEGWLPIPEICYTHKTPYSYGGNVPLDQGRKDLIPEIYRLEAFASTDSLFSNKGVVFVKFDLKQGNDGYLAIEAGGDSILELKNGILVDQKGHVYALFDKMWKQEGRLIKARLQPGKAATLAIATEPFNQKRVPVLDNCTYNVQRENCVGTWKSVLSKGMQVVTPEPVVNNMYRNSICQIFQLIKGDKIHYSSGNQYDKLYESEGSDAALALLAFGYTKEMRQLMVPLLEFKRKGLEFHHANFKLNNFCQYFWQSGDTNVVSELRPLWKKEVELLVNSRTGPGGLFPLEHFCTDIQTLVQSLNVNSQAWRAMRDVGAVLSESGNQMEASRYSAEANAFRKVVLHSIEKAVHRDTDPPFVPIALNGGEPVHDPIPYTRIGSYWNIVIGYTIRSGIFPPGSEEESWIPHYQEKHGGLCMGMIKFCGGQFNFWTSDQRVDPLYGARYSLDALRRDEPERALVSFYGMLAQGLTRNTFVGGEVSSRQPVDEKGRFFYCPPNSAASAYVLSMVRNLLVQDWDLNDDGKPETLRLGFGTPRRWLEDGKTIEVRNALTAFGQTSFSVKSDINAGKIVLNFTPPPRTPQKTFIRIRVPYEWLVSSASVGSEKLKVDSEGTVDVSSLKATSVIHFNVKKR